MTDFENILAGLSYYVALASTLAREEGKTGVAVQARVDELVDEHLFELGDTTLPMFAAALRAYVKANVSDLTVLLRVAAYLLTRPALANAMKLDASVVRREGGTHA